MLSKVDLDNLLIFMRRVTCTGEECGAWTQTYQAVALARQSLDAPIVQKVEETK